MPCPGGEDILMYGEPWQGGSTRMEHGAIPANKQAAGLLDSRIGFFCDNTRDAIKGGVFNAGSAGYINGDMHCGYQVLHSIPAWRGGQADFSPRRRARWCSMFRPMITIPCGIS